MRYNELLESKDIILDFIEKIKDDCSDILQIYNKTGRILFRGFDKLSGPIYYDVKPREDRHPLDTPINQQKYINDFLTDNGFIANRSNSFFCTADPNRAVMYGKPYIVFPKNGFDYTYGNTIDLYKEYNNSLRHNKDIMDLLKSIQQDGFGNISQRIAQYYDEYPQFKDFLFNFLSELKFANTHLNSALTSNYEVLIKGSCHLIDIKVYLNNKEYFNNLKTIYVDEHSNDLSLE